MALEQRDGAEVMALPDASLPGLFQAADRASLDGQRRFLTASRIRLGLVLVAAIGGAVTLRAGASAFDLAAAATAVALVGTALVETWLLTEKPDRTWYDGRALAESAKTTAWRYAVGAAPFGKDGEESRTDSRYIEQLANLLHDAPHTGIAPSAAPVISPEMRELRGSDLARRKKVYIEERIIGQQSWYARKAEWNRKRGLAWSIALVVVEILGVLTAMLRAFGVISIDLAGVIAAMIGIGVAWLAIKQHDTLGRAYALAANELSIIRARLEAVRTEEAWAAEARDAEEAISREHTMWRASRSTLLGPHPPG